MKSRIVKVIEKEYGKVISSHYNVEILRRDWDLIALGLMIPIIGWAMLLFDVIKERGGGFRKRWRVQHSFDKLHQAEYFVEHNFEIEETIEEVIK